MTKTCTIGDLFDMEKRVMAFYDDLLRKASSIGEVENLKLRAAAYEVVMCYRTFQVELSNAAARNRGVRLRELPLLDHCLPLETAEAAMLMKMKGIFDLHVAEMEKAVTEAKAGKSNDEFLEVIKSIGLTVLPKEVG
ncbi:hypothetical protein LCGC14_1456890 [marine sediment metagenome]|uniref:Uncharacterized protein n=1 Tax=marine sediment metagenome TaxID=412755 RepID=A0A0F9JG76_9ZZZZ